MMRISFHSLAAISLGWVAAAMPARAADCGNMFPNAAAIEMTSQPVTAGDLVRLRDIGFSNSISGATPFTVDPDGRRIAFMLTRADPVTNDYCQQLATLELRPGARPQVIADGGALSVVTQDVRGILIPVGVPRSATPQWSPDGRWLAFLKQREGVMQVWRVAADGREAARYLTTGAAEVESFVWSKSGDAILYATRAGLEAQKQAYAQEAREGFTYDERFGLNRALEPSMRSRKMVQLALNIATGETRVATTDERDLLTGSLSDGRPAHALSAMRGADGRIAWTQRQDPARILSPVELWVTGRDGQRIKCDACRFDHHDLERIWWDPAGDGLLYFVREGWGRSELVLYRWVPGNVPRSILRTEDILTGCQLSADRMLCAREGSTTPRHLESIDLARGTSQLLFDPNPEVTPARLGKVERLHWKNAAGFEIFGDLILPRDRKRDEKLPLIIVQYRTRGFLRGGTGDEYPIHVFAARGYAVLSVDRPPPYFESIPEGSWSSWNEADPLNQENWNDRRNVLSAIEGGVQLLQARGVIDPRRIGITGLSEGATSTRFALVNRPDMFAAAAISTCCFDVRAMMVYGGTAVAEERRRAGFPSAFGDLSPWKSLALSENAATFHTPLLIQVADAETVTALETFMALREFKKPVDMYVFPGEFHNKWQPAHRLAIYDRNLDWFDFWLRQREDADQAKAAQYARWRKLRP